MQTKSAHLGINNQLKMTIRAKKIQLPTLVVTQLAEATDLGAIQVPLPAGSPDKVYFVRPKQERFNLFPLVLNADGAPWAEANIYLLSRMKESMTPAISTYSCIADDLAAFRRFLDDTGIDWLHFPSHKLSRPTYRYHGHLKLAIAAGEIASSTAKRRMSAVISFYTWLKNEGLLITQFPPWKASDRYIQLKDNYGFQFSKHITSTDISINISKNNDPYAETIDDGGKLRPLSKEEQGWLIDALNSLANIEMTLIHLFGLITGARIQTILTFKVRHIRMGIDQLDPYEIRLPVGPGTGVDTKNDKQLVLHIPVWFYRMLQTYAQSERAQQRRKRSPNGDTENQYLFLSVRGVPLYQSKAELQTFRHSSTTRHAKIGQGVRQFMKECVIPFIKQKYNAPNFTYKFHDTRATFGMNLTDHQLMLVSTGEVTLHEAREFVKTRMCHESSATTDLYLKYRQNLKLVRNVNANYNDHLQALVQSILLK